MAELLEDEAEQLERSNDGKENEEGFTARSLFAPATIVSILPDNEAVQPSEDDVEQVVAAKAKDNDDAALPVSIAYRQVEQINPLSETNERQNSYQRVLEVHLDREQLESADYEYCGERYHEEHKRHDILLDELTRLRVGQ